MVTAARPKIRLLGEPVLQTPDGSRLPFRTLKVPALLGYLVARAGRPSPRVQIAEALWPDRQAAPALQNLRQTLLYLRGLLGDAMLHANRREVRLQTGLADCDVESFRSALHADPERAVALYTGPFLDGFDDDWVLPLRAELSHAYVKALLGLSDRDLDENPAAALEWAERAIAEERFHDGARARKIRALRRLGEETRALREFEAYEALLDEELGLRPATIVEDALSDRPASTVSRPRDDHATASTDFNDALRVLSEGERPQDAVRLAVSLAPYWMEVGTPGEGLRRLDAARARWSEPDEQCLRASACLAAGELALRTGDVERVVAEATKVLERLAGPEETVAALVLLGRVHARRRETREARSLTVRALRLARREGIPTGEAWALMGSAYFLEDRLVPGIAAARRAQADAKGSKRLFARAGILIGMGLATLGQDAEARAVMEEAVDSVADDRSFETAGIRVNAARQFEEFGDHARAEKGYREGISEFRSRGDAWSLALSLTYLGDLKTALDRSAEAIPLYEEALGIRVETRDVLGQATCLRGLGSARCALGDALGARATLREAVRLYAEVDWNAGVASCLVPLARAEAAIGSRPLARRLAARSVALLRAMDPVTRIGIGPRGGSLLPTAERLLDELSG